MIKNILIHHPLEDNLIVAGCDEAGCGALFGPVVAASVLLPKDWYNSELNDSKKLTEKKRDKLYEIILNDVISYSIQEVDAKKIDEINILQARFLAMNNCIENMSIKPDHILIDGNRFYNQYPIPFSCIIKGDGKYLSIAAASILAKVYRDNLITELSKKYDKWMIQQHKGYPTQLHKELIKRNGLSDLHRTTFCKNII